MTRFDIRIRRKQFTQSRIERHKDFQNLLGNYDRSSRIKTRGVMVLIFLTILIIAILLAFFGTIKEPKKDVPKEEIGKMLESSKTHEIKENEFINFYITGAPKLFLFV